LHGKLNETVYMHQPIGFRDLTHLDYVCLLKKSLYGLKQAPRAWIQRFADFVSTIGFTHSISDHSLFIRNIMKWHTFFFMLTTSFSLPHLTLFATLSCPFLLLNLL